MSDVSMADDTTDATLEASATPVENASLDNAPGKKTNATNVHAILRRKLQQCRRIRREFVPEWSTNIDYLRAKAFDSMSDNDRVAVTVDWSNTKKKKASLFSQVPKLRLKTRKRWAKTLPQPARQVFQDKVNDTIEDIELGEVMDECLSNVINAAGICAALVTFESRVEERDLTMPEEQQEGPILPPLAPPAAPAPGAAAPVPGAQPPMPGGQMGAMAPPTAVIPYSTSRRINVESISPADYLWDVSFTKSNFNKIPLQGNSGRMHWAQALKEFGQSEDNPNGLIEADRPNVAGRDDRNDLDMLTHQADRQRYKDSDLVAYDQIFYRRFYFHEDEQSFEAIQRVVFVRGKPGKPVIDELWKGQKKLDNGEIVGSCKFPIQVCTLAYVTDEAIPPSDTAMGRPQVDELQLGRSMMMAQRRFSLPWRWFNNNLVPPELVTLLMKGEYQGAVPLNGSGDKVMGEVARANYPRDDYEFDRVAKAELDSSWNIGTSMSGGGAGNTQIRSAAEAAAVQANMNSVMAMDRSKFVKFFCNIGEVIGGLLALHGDWTEDELQAMGTWDREKISSYFLYSVRGDASVRMDAQSRYAQLKSFWNDTAKSGMVDETEVVREMASLSDIDEAYVHPPVPPPPPSINLSIRLDAASLDDPVVVALLMKSGQFPDPQALAQAKAAIIAAKQVPQPGEGGPQPGGPGGAPPAAGPGGGAPPVAHPPVTDAMPHLNEADRVNKRNDHHA